MSVCVSWSVATTLSLIRFFVKNWDQIQKMQKLYFWTIRHKQPPEAMLTASVFLLLLLFSTMVDLSGKTTPPCPEEERWIFLDEVGQSLSEQLGMTMKTGLTIMASQPLARKVPFPLLMAYETRWFPLISGLNNHRFSSRIVWKWYGKLMGRGSHYWGSMEKSQRMGKVGTLSPPMRSLAM